MPNKKRIVFAGSARLRGQLEATAKDLDLTKTGALKFGVLLLAAIAKELDKGNKLVFKNQDGTEREIIIPQLGLGKD